MRGVRRQIIYDLDGTFSEGFDGTSRSAATIMDNFKHIEDEPDCHNPTDTNVWEDTLICDDSVPIRKIMFQNMVK